MAPRGFRRQDYLPIEPFRAVIRDWISRCEETDPYTTLGELLWPGQDPRITTSRIRLILAEEGGARSRVQEHISFDLADLILCRTGKTLLWHTDQTFSDLYWSVNMLSVDVNDPTCEAAAEETRQRIIETFRRVGSKLQTQKELGIGETQVRRAIRSAEMAVA